MRTLVLFAAVVLCGAFAVPAAAQPGHTHHETAKPVTKHPAPREGITGEHVLRADAVPARAQPAYADAARVPQVMDGLYCHCECHDRDGLRSLLECFENAMATTCGICQGQAQMAARLHDEGKTLEQIRAAIDAQYGR